MLDFFIKSIVWILALYGFFDIIKDIIRMSFKHNHYANGTYVVVLVKNQANSIEVFLKSIIFRILYGKESDLNKIILVDLNSADETSSILEKLSKDYDILDLSSWNNLKNQFDKLYLSNELKDEKKHISLESQLTQNK